MVRWLLAARVLAPNISHVAGQIREVIGAVLLLVAEDLPRDVLKRVLGTGVTCVHRARLMLGNLAVVGAAFVLLFL